MRAGVGAWTTLGAAFLLGCGQDTFTTAGDAATSDDMIGGGDVAPVDSAVEAMAGDCGNAQTSPENCGACGHSCLGGDCDSGACMPVTLAMNQAPYLIAVDDRGIYWTSLDLDGGVTRANKDGGAPQLLSKHKPVEAIAVHDGYVYYSGITSLEKVPTGGGGTTSIVANVRTHDLVVDSQVYSTTQDVGGTGVTRRDLGFLNPVSTANQGGVPAGIALDATQVYFALGNEIRSVDKTTLSPGASLASQMSPEGVAADDHFVFWTNYGDGSVKRAAPSLAASVTIASTQNGPHRLALDAKYVYWTNGGGTIMRVDKQGVGTPVFLYSGPPGPRGIAVDGEAVYWTNETSGAVMKVAKPID